MDHGCHLAAPCGPQLVEGVLEVVVFEGCPELVTHLLHVVLYSGAFTTTDDSTHRELILEIQLDKGNPAPCAREKGENNPMRVQARLPMEHACYQKSLRGTLFFFWF